MDKNMIPLYITCYIEMRVVLEPQMISLMDYNFIIIHIFT